jgi:hypothetical protein
LATHAPLTQERLLLVHGGTLHCTYAAQSPLFLQEFDVLTVGAMSTLDEHAAKNKSVHIARI